MFGLLICGLPPLLVAQEERATVRLYGRLLFRVSATPEMDALARARQVERRLLRLLESPEAIAPARAEPSGDAGEDRIITVAGVPVITVTTADAEENLATVDAVARQWITAIDTALAEAPQETGVPALLLHAQGAFRSAFARLLESVVLVVPGVAAAAFVLLLFAALAAGARALVRVILEPIVRDITVRSLFKQSTYYFVWALGIIVAANALGFDTATVITGLGLTSLALGFALKDILSNFVSGLLILFLRPFQLGDQIVVGETEGSVERIELRATQIRTYDGRVVFVPNADVFTSRVTNNTAAPLRRATVQIFLAYQQDLVRAMDVVRSAVENTAGVLGEPPIAVRIGQLQENSAMLETQFWADSRRSDYAATTAAVRAAIIESCKKAGIALPDGNARTLEPGDPAAWQEAFGDGRMAPTRRAG